MKRLTKKEWNQLDDLLGKHGFGGYYDMLECLKMSIHDLEKIIDKKLPEPTSIFDAVHQLMTLTPIIKRKLKK